VDTLVLALPAIANVVSLCFLVMFVFTIIGMDFYGHDALDRAYTSGGYNQQANFRTFGNGFMLLFRAVTSARVNGIMHDIMVADCDPRLDPSR